MDVNRLRFVFLRPLFLARNVRKHTCLYISLEAECIPFQTVRGDILLGQHLE